MPSPLPTRVLHDSAPPARTRGRAGRHVWTLSFALTTMASMLGFFMLPMCLIPVVGVPHLLLRTTIPWLLGR